MIKFIQKQYSKIDNKEKKIVETKRQKEQRKAIPGTLACFATFPVLSGILFHADRAIEPKGFLNKEDIAAFNNAFQDIKLQDIKDAGENLYNLFKQGKIDRKSYQNAINELQNGHTKWVSQRMLKFLKKVEKQERIKSLKKAGKLAAIPVAAYAAGQGISQIMKHENLKMNRARAERRRKEM